MEASFRVVLLTSVTNRSGIRQTYWFLDQDPTFDCVVDDRLKLLNEVTSNVDRHAARE